MHELFANILAKRDLSRAGELFSGMQKKITCLKFNFVRFIYLFLGISLLLFILFLVEDEEIASCLTDVVYIYI